MGCEATKGGGTTVVFGEIGETRELFAVIGTFILGIIIMIWIQRATSS